MQAKHVVVWLDHSEAHIFAFNRDVAEHAVIVFAPHDDSGNFCSYQATAEYQEYFEHILDKIRNIPEWLVVGPSNAKLAFAKHLNLHHENLLDHLIGIETVDHPTDGQLLAYAKKYFLVANRLMENQVQT